MPELPQRAITTRRPLALKPLRQRREPPGPCSLLITAYASFRRGTTSNSAVIAIAPSGCALIKAPQRPIAAIYTPTRRVRIKRKATTLLPTPRIRTPSTTPLPLSTANTLRVLLLPYSTGRGTSIPLSAPLRSASTTTPSKATTEVSANRRKEMFEPRTHSKLSHA